MIRRVHSFVLIVLFLLPTFLFSQNKLLKPAAVDSNITLLGRLPVGRCKAAFPFGDHYAIIGSGRGVRIMDISDKSYPLMISEVHTTGEVSDVVVNGSSAYVTLAGAGMYVSEDFPGGLVIIDISNPAQPKVKSFYDTDETCLAVTVVNNYAYVAGNGEIIVFNVSDPINPQKITSVNLGESAHGLFASGDYLYVAAQGAGFRIYSLSDPANPSLVGQYGVWAEKVWVQDTLAFVSRQTSGAMILSVSDPANPYRLSEIVSETLTDYFYGVTARGNYLFFSGTSSNGSGSPMLKIFDISDTKNPTLVGTFYDSTAMNGGNIGERIMLFNNYALMAVTYNFRIFDISDPAHPIQTAQYDTYISKGDVQIDGNLAFYAYDLANTPNTALSIIDVSNPGCLREIGYIYPSPEKNSDVRVSVNNGYAYLTQSSFPDSIMGIHVIDVRDPSHPRQVAFLHIKKQNNLVITGGPYLYTESINGDTIRVFDISDPENAKEVSQFGIDVWSFGFPKSFYLTDDYLYCGTTTGLLIFSLSNAPWLTYSGFYHLEGDYYDVRGVRVVGDLAYLATQSGLLVVNVQDPNNPYKIAETAGQFMDVETINNDIYVAAYFLGINLYNWLNDTTLIRNGFYQEKNMWAYRLATDGSNLYAAYDGLMIFRKGPATGIAEQHLPVAKEFELSQNYPNPFNPETHIKFMLYRKSRVKIAIYNSAGQLVKQLLNEVKPAGSYEILWNAQRLGSGMYFIKVTADGYSQVRKALLVK